MESQYKSVLVGEIQESTTNPRRHFPEREMKELTESIREKGVISPLLLRHVNSHYEIVDGARRFRAAKAAGLDVVPAVIRPMTDEQALETQVIANLQRQDVHPLDEAEGYKRLLDTKRFDVPALVARMGKDPSYIYKRLALNNLIEPMKKAYWKEEITLGHALLLARLQPEDQKHYRITASWTIQHLKADIEQRVMCILDAVNFDKNDPLLVEKAGPCTTCPKRSGFNKDLFNDITTKDRCMDPGCFEAKIEAHVGRTQADAKKKKIKLVQLSGDSWSDDRSLVTRAGDYSGSQGWRHAKHGCPDPKPGVIVEGREAGRTVEVCLNVGCKICNPGHRNSSSSRSQSRAIGSKARYARRLEIWNNRVEQLARQKTYEKLLPLINPVLGREHLEMLIRELHQRNHGPMEDVLKILGFKVRVFDRWRHHKIKDWKAALGKATERQLAQLLFGLLLQQEMINDPSIHSPDRGCLDLLVGIHGKGKVDVKAIAAEAQKQLESKRPKSPAEKTATKKAKASPKPRKKVRAVYWPGAKCEVCGCTDENACESGCAWDKAFEKEGRAVCTNCIDKAKPLKSKRPKKSGKSKKSKTRKEGK